MGGDLSYRILEDYVALQKRLKKAGRGDLRKDISRAIKKEAQPALNDTKRAISSLHVKGTRGGGKAQRRKANVGRAKNKVSAAKKNTSLRVTIARAIRLKQRISGRSAGVTIEVQSDLLPVGQRKLPKYLDNPNGWRHPVFGNRKKWAAQAGGPWFASTIRRHAPAIRAAIRREISKFRG